MSEIVIKRSSPDANVFVILTYLNSYKRALNRKRIKTPKIDKFVEKRQYEDMDYEEVIKKVEELTHGFVKVR